jgi:tetratricopeptide (TPR) repeat protein
MDKGKTLRIGLVAGAILLMAGIYFLPKKPQLKENAEAKTESVTSSDFSFEKYVSDSRTKLPWDAGDKISKWEDLLKTDSSSIGIYDSIGKAWDANSLPGIAAWFFERKAVQSKAEKDWLNAAYRYFDAFKASKDSIESSYFVQQAIRSYTNVTTLNPSNLDAKTDLGILYAEGTGEPMKGIMLLREVVTTNPMHENAHLNLGFLSMKSGQFEKAVERFNKVLEINSARVDMYVYLGEAYVRMGNKEKAIESFEVFKNLSNDPQMIKEVDDYIKAIKAK